MGRLWEERFGRNGVENDGEGCGECRQQWNGNMCIMY